MQVRAGFAGRGAVHAALLAGVLTGCSEAAPKAAGDQKATATASTEAAVAVKGGTIGATGSACELPVTFDIATDWKAEAVDGGGSGDDPADIADALPHQGPVALRCEIDAKPAGNIGFLRVWTGEPAEDDARAVLEAFVEAAAGASKATYRTFDAGGVDGAEVRYLYTSDLLETKQESALAVVTPDGPVVLHLGGLDTEEHKGMLPAYQLAKRTLRGR
ncbi:lipoprotein [Streptomyces blattellae]|uniref:lipoprotein n=1 Tax=Streptomyces blattellae TaxID=2569855 RepID=UPI0012BA20C3|nr:lipoprotein [Streptomyces blattellae]